jgi:hypothetical protein
MSAIGPKQTSLVATHMSAFGGKADITRTRTNVRLWQPSLPEIAFATDPRDIMPGAFELPLQVLSWREC